MKVAGIKKGTDDHPKHQQKKGLDRANPRDGRWGQGREIVLLIIRLKGTEGIDDAPGTMSVSPVSDGIDLYLPRIEEQEERSYHL
jgi:hypothetical protein